MPPIAEVETIHTDEGDLVLKSTDITRGVVGVVSLGGIEITYTVIDENSVEILDASATPDATAKVIYQRGKDIDILGPDEVGQLSGETLNADVGEHALDICTETRDLYVGSFMEIPEAHDILPNT